MWIAFLTDFNGRAMFLDASWVTNSTFELYTDAARTIGFGCYFQRPIEGEIQCRSIAWLELFFGAQCFGQIIKQW